MLKIKYQKFSFVKLSLILITILNFEISIERKKCDMYTEYPI